MHKLSLALAKRALALPIVAATIFVSGCATMTSEQCASADWYAIGIQDGTLGLAPSRAQNHEKSCARHGLGLDSGSYHAGRKKGLKIYCTVENGIEAGKSGIPYRYVCPSSHEPSFLSGYYVGALSVFGN